MCNWELDFKKETIIIIDYVFRDIFVRILTFSVACDNQHVQLFTFKNFALGNSETMHCKWDPFAEIGRQ